MPLCSLTFFARQAHKTLERDGPSGPVGDPHKLHRGGISGAQRTCDRTDSLQTSPKSCFVVWAFQGDRTEVVADTSEFAATLGATVLVLNHLHDNPPQLDTGEWIQQLQLVANEFTSAINSLLQSTPAGSTLASALLAALNAVRTNSEIVSLNENEALLYARAFHQKGFSMRLFRKLLASGGYRWVKASKGARDKRSHDKHMFCFLKFQCLVFTPANPSGDMIHRAEDGDVKILVQGTASRVGDDLPQGNIKGGQMILEESIDVIACEDVVFIAWDKAGHDSVRFV